jgi:hypothetical protein
MSAPGITYSGVLAKKGATNSEKKGIFEDIKFWVSARVPHRKICVDTIKVGNNIVNFYVSYSTSTNAS